MLTRIGTALINLEEVSTVHSYQFGGLRVTMKNGEQVSIECKTKHDKEAALKKLLPSKPRKKGVIL